jgi:hypothetical protein
MGSPLHKVYLTASFEWIDRRGLPLDMTADEQTQRDTGSVRTDQTRRPMPKVYGGAGKNGQTLRPYL